MRPGPAVAGALLTGGLSRRMGFDKALVEVDGVANAARLAQALGEVVWPLVEVGPGHTGVRAVRESPVGSGPLSALCAGAGALQQMGHAGPVLVVACDLPRVTREVLARIAQWPGEASVVPVVKGQAQPLCARWSPADIALATRLVAAGERSMKALLAGVVYTALVRTDWPGSSAEDVFADVDTPMDLKNLGLCPPRGATPAAARSAGP